MTDSEQFQVQLAEAQKSADHARNADKWWKIGLAVACIIGIFISIVLWNVSSENAKLRAVEANRADAAQSTTTQIANEAQKVACRRIDGTEVYDPALCQLAKEAAADATKPAAQPDQPPAGPTNAQVALAVSQYCDAGKCQGANGRTPTADDVAKAVAAACKGSCNGADGEPGANAPAITADQLVGAVATYCATGACVGPQGVADTGPTEAQIASAVNAYCGTGACKGPAGEPGESVPQTIKPSWRCNADGTAVLIINGVEALSPLKCPVEPPPTTPAPVPTPAPTPAPTGAP